MITLILIYPNTSRFIVGGFQSLDEIEAWLDQARGLESWIDGTTYETIDSSGETA